MYILAPFILQNFKKILRADPELWDVPFAGPKWRICNEQIFFGTNHYYYFHLPTGPFDCAKSRKILTAYPELWECAIYGPKMVQLPHFLGRKLLISSSSTCWPLCKILKKFFLRIQSYEDAQFLSPKWPISPNENFFQKTCSLALFSSFMPIYVPKSKVRY